MHVLVTGGAGFIGSHLADRLVAGGDTVTIIDNLATGKKENIAGLLGHERFSAHFDTILNVSLMEDLVSKCDVIYHLAAPVGVKWIMTHPIETITENVRGIDILMTAAAKYRKKILIASTSEVYGEHMDGRISEESKCIMGTVQNHRWAYAYTKAVDEFLGLAYYKEQKLPVVVCRFFNTVGPRQSNQYGMVIPSFISQALNNQPITVYGDGEQSRSFLYVADLLDGVEKLMALPQAEGELFNLGNEIEITMNDLALLVKKMANSSSEIVHVPYQEAYGAGFEDMRRRIPDISKAKRFVGFSPSHSLPQIIEKMVEHHRITMNP